MQRVWRPKAPKYLCKIIVSLPCDYLWYAKYITILSSAYILNTSCFHHVADIFFVKIVFVFANAKKCYPRDDFCFGWKQYELEAHFSRHLSIPRLGLLDGHMSRDLCLWDKERMQPKFFPHGKFTVVTWPMPTLNCTTWSYLLPISTDFCQLPWLCLNIFKVFDDMERQQVKLVI